MKTFKYSVHCIKCSGLPGKSLIVLSTHYLLSYILLYVYKFMVLTKSVIFLHVECFKEFISVSVRKAFAEMTKLYIMSECVL